MFDWNMWIDAHYLKFCIKEVNQLNKEKMKTIKFKQESKLLKFYSWVWFDADPGGKDFCKVLWGIILSPLAMITFIPVRSSYRFVDARITDAPKKKKTWEELVARTDKFRAKEIARRARRNKWSDRFDRIANSIIFRAGVWITAITALVVIVSLLGYTIATNITQTLIVLGVTGLAVVVLSMMIGIIFLMGLSHENNGVIKSVDDSLTFFFKEFIPTGYHSFKTRTCPKVEIIDAVESNKSR